MKEKKKVSIVFLFSLFCLIFSIIVLFGLLFVNCKKNTETEEATTQEFTFENLLNSNEKARASLEETIDKLDGDLSVSGNTITIDFVYGGDADTFSDYIEGKESTFESIADNLCSTYSLPLTLVVNYKDGEGNILYTITI